MNREVVTESECPLPALESTFVIAVTNRFPNATVSSQKLMTVLFISGADSVKANSKPVVDTSTSAVVRTM